MAKGWDMGLRKSLLRWVRDSKIPLDLMGLPFLGLVTYYLFRHASSLRPLEGALLVVATAGLIRTGLRWWDWHQGLVKDGPLQDWVQRILQGEREMQGAGAARREQDHQVVAALNALIRDLQEERQQLNTLRSAVGRDWIELDGLIGTVLRYHASDLHGRVASQARLESLGRDLKRALEDTLRLDQMELNYRLRADQFRLQGQAFRSTLEQVQSSLEQFDNLLEELADSFPQLRRQEEALGRLADAGLRQGARLSLSVKGLIAHAPRLVEGAQARMEWLSRLRRSTDGVRDLIEALARRQEAFRAEAQERIRSFGGAVGSLEELDHVAQQAGLLAVNASILAQQEGGNAGMAEVGNRLRNLADQSTTITARLARSLESYERGLAHESAGLWDLQELAQQLVSDVQELLRQSGHLDLQGHDLERALEAHLSLAEELRQASERAELSLHEVGARALALEAAHGRQWGVEAKMAPERERLARLESRLGEVGEGLSRVCQQSIEELWDILARHQEVRKTPAFREVVSKGLPKLMDEPSGSVGAWNALAWAREARGLRRLEAGGRGLAPLGQEGRDGSIHLALFGQDALQLPEPSAIDGLTSDPTGQVWTLSLLKPLRTERLRLALLARLKESALPVCLPGLDMRIAPDGVSVRLPHPYPGFPAFLAGLDLDLAVDPDDWTGPVRPFPLKLKRHQAFLWLGPGQGGGLGNPLMQLVHGWVEEASNHEAFLGWLAHPGPRPPCPWIGNLGVDAPLVGSPVPMRCLGLGADPLAVRPIFERLLASGMAEGSGGGVLCVASVGHPHPDAFLLRLFQADADLAGAFHPDLVPFQMRLREEVLGARTGDSYAAGWSLLEDLHRTGWILPLPDA